MKYRINPKNQDKISQLAFGCMRFPRDQKQVDALVHTAMERGVNYFDTAHMYPGNEEALAKALQGGRREKVFVATKLPQYLVRKAADFDRMLNTELERLQTGYIDYYFLHMFTHAGEWPRLAALGIEEWIAEKKARGIIRNIGFSYHGGSADFIRILDFYDWDHCMIQYNYFDENSQAGRAGLLAAAAKGLPVMIMEPLRGGQLARLPEEAQKPFLDAAMPGNPAEWAFRWLYDQPEITTVLSGMNTMDMLEENIRVAESASPGELTDKEKAAYTAARQVLLEKTMVPCTGCNYCAPCPQNVDISTCFAHYNDWGLAKRKASAVTMYAIRAGDRNAGRCIACGKCEKHCPQSIAISQRLAEMKRDMEPWYYKPFKAAASLFLPRE